LLAADGATYPNADAICGFSGVFQVASIAVQSDVRLLLFCRDCLDFPKRWIQLFGRAIAAALRGCPYDVDFLLWRASHMSAAKVAGLRSRGFSYAGMNWDEVFESVVAIFHLSGVLDDLRIDKPEFVRFLVDVRAHYNPVPYHNWGHAADATQFVFAVLSNGRVGDFLTRPEVCALLVAAITHDLDHDGHTNMFHRKTFTVHAQLASPSLPPLELHHATLAINMFNLRYPRIVEEWEPGAVRHFENFVVSCILATDMERHQYFIDEFRRIKPDFDRASQAHRTLLGQIIMKCADLSNTVRNFPDSVEMTERLMNEFFSQGDLEGTLGVEISPMCDRKTAAPTAVGQVGFYKFVAGPLMKELHSFFPELTDVAEQYEMNLAQWTELKEHQ
jgi:high affinity cGMP-specific 3',5'-cyclic phosphodiesterase 9